MRRPLTGGSDSHGGCAYRPAFSPDGSTLAYVDCISPGFGADSGEKILLRSLASGTIGDIVINIVELATKSLTHLEGGFHPSFSPDGSRVLYEGDCVSNCRWWASPSPSCGGRCHPVSPF